MVVIPNPAFSGSPRIVDPAVAQFGDGRIEVVAHERELVHRRRTLLDRVHAELGGRQFEDQPARLGFDVVPPEHVAEHLAESLRLRRVEQAVDSGDRHSGIVVTRVRALSASRRV